MTTLDHVGSCTGGNTIPLDDEGRTYHFGCKEGEVANHILIVSSYQLAEEISKLFDKTEPVFRRESNRGYLTYTGLFKGKRISVVAFGIGFAMIDFLLRELRRITKGPLEFIELGEATNIDAELGEVIVIKDAVAAEIDYENFSESDLPFHIFKNPVPANAELISDINAKLKEANIKSKEGRALSCPSFCHGVSAPTLESGGVGCFDFKNKNLLSRVQEDAGPINSLEMDVYPLLWTSLRSTEGNIRSAAVSVTAATMDGKFLEDEAIIKRMLELAPILMGILSEKAN
ncbi:purine and uridine phosphorylase [Histomonas meleagridis]|uniref:purine and uridine phosphorylase n=1 Tax=Histomonas meleagridis TaxID=135588 RepID=UPI00355AC810|nr:purine and uridine phosphorylase [Histomonas meleagridis]KAH0806479.1 purine and uridine phosphorylase [Histomonas meleagridis]